MYSLKKVREMFGLSDIGVTFIFILQCLLLYKIVIVWLPNWCGEPGTSSRRDAGYEQGNIKIRMLHPLFPIYFIIILIIGMVFQGAFKTTNELKKVCIWY